MIDDVSSSAIRQRYERVMEEIEVSARKSGRMPEEVRLVVVTKGHPVETIRRVIDVGARALGENYADEALPKINVLHDQVEVQWHMIGHVQSRKAGIIARQFNFLHSLDSLKLAEKLDRLCADAQIRLPVLLEMNVSGEASKSGFAVWDKDTWNDLIPVFEKLLALQHLEVCGLMTIPPYYDQPELARPFFRKLRTLQKEFSKRFPGNEWRELSMGMSGDFEVAIEEGATWVRIGTRILGPRPGSDTVIYRGG